MVQFPGIPNDNEPGQGDGRVLIHGLNQLFFEFLIEHN